MTDKMHIADVELSLYAMGALLPAEASVVEAHLNTCTECSEEVRLYTQALAAYAQSTPEVPLPSEMAQEMNFMTVRKAITRNGNWFERI